MVKVGIKEKEGVSSLEVVENSEFASEILEHYKFQPRKFYKRITRLISCPRRTVHEVFGTPALIDESTITRLLVGVAGHEVLEVLGVTEKEVTLEGYYGHIDMIAEKIVEIKITWIGTKRKYMTHWIKQLMAYCHMEKTNEGILLILHIMGDYTRPIKPILKAYTFKFTQQELEDNWKLIQENERIITEAIKEKKMPWQAGEEWECKMCQYAHKCELGDDFGSEMKVEPSIFR